MVGLLREKVCIDEFIYQRLRPLQINFPFFLSCFVFLEFIILRNNVFVGRMQWGVRVFSWVGGHQRVAAQLRGAFGSAPRQYLKKLYSASWSAGAARRQVFF